MPEKNFERSPADSPSVSNTTPLEQALMQDWDRDMNIVDNALSVPSNHDVSSQDYPATNIDASSGTVDEASSVTVPGMEEQLILRLRQTTMPLTMSTPEITATTDPAFSRQQPKIAIFFAGHKLKSLSQEADLSEPTTPLNSEERRVASMIKTSIQFPNSEPAISEGLQDVDATAANALRTRSEWTLMRSWSNTDTYTGSTSVANIREWQSCVRRLNRQLSHEVNKALNDRDRVFYDK